MKKLIIILILMGMTSGLLVAGSLESGISIYQIDKEKNPSPSISQYYEMNSERVKINKDAFIILSKNSRELSRSTKYLLQILNSQINWEYRTIIHSRHKQFDIQDYLDMLEQNYTIPNR